MKTLIFIIVLLFTAALVAFYAMENPGYVLISRAPWSIEMTLTVFIPLLVLGFFLFYLFVTSPSIPGHKRNQRHHKVLGLY